MSVLVSAVKLREMCAAGLTMHEAAAELGLTYITVWRKARISGVRGWKRHAHASGIAASENSQRALAMGRAIKSQISHLSLADYERYVSFRRMDPLLTPGGALAAVLAVDGVRHA